MSAPRKILLVDDDPDIASVLARALALNGYEPVLDDRPETARKRFRDENLDAAIIDVMIGLDSGLDLVEAIRRDGVRKPILMLSALSAVEDRTRGLQAGADDYVVKPFELKELLARLEVQLSRSTASAAPLFSLDHETRTVRAGDTQASLTEREAAVLRILMDRMGRPVSRGEIFDSLWTQDGTSSENVVDVYVGYLRRKLSPPSAFGVEIQTIRSRGFVLKTID